MKRKIIFVFLILVTVANLIIFIIALTKESGPLYDYRFLIGISFIMFGGFLRKYISKYNKKS